MKYPYRKLVTNSNSLSIAFDKDKLKEVSSSQSAVSHLEVIKNGKIGTSSITGTHEFGLWERAQNSAEFGDKVAYLYGAQKKYQGESVADHLDRNLGDGALQEQGVVGDTAH